MAGMGKVKALQIWCRNRVLGYKDVEITNMTTSWRDGLAFCALIHRFRPDLIDYESLSKENVLENNELAFEVAEVLGIPALLDAEDMVRLETPDKLSIITYVAQLHNYFRDKDPVGGPGIKTASKRHSTPVQRSVTMRSPESKRKPALISPSKKEESQTVSPGSDLCVVCDGRVYLIEKQIADGKLYHRGCFKQNNRKTTASGLTPKPTATENTPPSRPSALSSNGLTKRAPSSLPSTPGTPPDTRPDWQRKLQERSAAKKNIAARPGSQPPLDSLPEGFATPRNKTVTEHPKSEIEGVKLRTKNPNPLLSKSKTPMPRAVSVGVDMDERITKLRQLRASAKASGAAPNPALKARLEKLHAMTSAKRESERSSGSKAGAETKRSEVDSIKTEAHSTNAKTRAEGDEISTNSEKVEELSRSDVAMETDTHGGDKNEIKPDDIVTHSVNDLDLINRDTNRSSKDLARIPMEIADEAASASDAIVEPDTSKTKTKSAVMSKSADSESLSSVTSASKEANVDSSKNIAMKSSGTRLAADDGNVTMAKAELTKTVSENVTEKVMNQRRKSVEPEVKKATASSESTLSSIAATPAKTVVEPASTSATTTSKATLLISTTPSAPVRTRRSQNAKSANKVTSSPSPSAASPKPESASNENTAEAPLLISPTRLPLDSLNITVSSSPSNSRSSTVIDTKETIDKNSKSKNTAVNTKMKTAVVISPKASGDVTVTTETSARSKLESSSGRGMSTEEKRRMSNDRGDIGKIETRNSGKVKGELIKQKAITKNNSMEDTEAPAETANQDANDEIQENDQKPTINEVITQKNSVLKEATPSHILVIEQKLTDELSEGTAKEDSEQSACELEKMSSQKHEENAQETEEKNVQKLEKESSQKPEENNIQKQGKQSMRKSVELNMQKQEKISLRRPKENNVQKVDEWIPLASEEKNSPKSEERNLPNSEEKIALQPEEKIASKPEETIASKPEEKIASKPEETIASKLEETIASMPEEKNSPKSEERNLPEPEEKIALQPEETIASKPEETIASKLEETIAQKTKKTKSQRPEEKVVEECKEVNSLKAEKIVQKPEKNILHKADEKNVQGPVVEQNVKKPEEINVHKSEERGVQNSEDESIPRKSGQKPEEECKTPKPARPPVSPALTKRLTSKDKDGGHPRGDGTITGPENVDDLPVIMRQSTNSSKKAPPRPKTVAAGPVAKSHFYMDETHQQVLERPPKPARQQTALSQAKNNWEDTLESWSSRRKDQNRSTWYTAESYPTEHNPFGEEEIGDENEKPNTNQNNGQLPTQTETTNYDDSLNPFADEHEQKPEPSNPFAEDDEEIKISRTDVAEDSNPHKKKVIHFNPFEVSDDEEEAEVIDKRKVVPDQSLSAGKPKAKRNSNVITLPNTSKKVTPKKKLAPSPPTQAPPTSQAPPTQAPPTLQASSTSSETIQEVDVIESTPVIQISTQLIENENIPADTITNADDSKFNTIEEEENASPDVQRKKHRPAPPRPMPPKRRIYPVFQLSV